jgi:predicted nucleic acid-binding protein
MAGDLELDYWDSCMFIDLMQQTPGRYDRCNYQHERAKAGELLIVTSTVTLAEVTRIHAAGVVSDELSQKILDYFENEYIVVRQLDRAIAIESHKLCRAHNLIHLDAIHLATALEMKVAVLYTFDSKKQRRKGLLRWNLKIGNPPLRIEEPPADLFNQRHDDSGDAGENGGEAAE